MLALNELSKIGFGAYRVSVDNEENHKALLSALESGCNLIDTSSNYMRGRSELLIGKILEENPKQKAFIVTKAGYIQNDNLKVISELHAKNLATEDLVTLKENFKHSIHPDFLENQIQTSLKRLRRKFIDGFLLHNPEYYFNQNGSVSQEEYYSRIKKAFAFLEEKVASGIIRYYGVSSNTFPLPESDPKSTKLDVLLNIAREVTSSNHFKLIQFPYNLVEDGAIRKYSSKKSLIEVAKENSLITFCNRPLNASLPSGPLRIASYEDQIGRLDPDTDTTLFNRFLDMLRKELKKNDVLTDILEFQIINHLNNNWMKIGNPEAVDQLFHGHLYPLLEQIYSKRVPSETKNIFYKLTVRASDYSRKLMTHKAVIFVDEIIQKGKMKKYDDMSIAAMACRNYLDDGIDHVLVGMKASKYVQDMKALF